jgi:hypothetical protein
VQPGVAFRVEAGNPTMGALAADPHRLGDMRHGHPLDTNTLHQQTTTMKGQTGVTVRHEDLRFVKRQTPQDPEVFTYVNPVTNLMAGYS